MNQPTLPEQGDTVLREYRQWLISAEQKAQEDFDKTVLSLSGGALGVSFVFLKDVLGAAPVLVPDWLFAAWLSWGSSTICVLLSYFLSHLALRYAIEQTDAGSIYVQRPGGAMAVATAGFNLMGVVLFLVGVVAMTCFARANLLHKPLKGVILGSQTVVTSTTATPTPTPNSKPAP